MSAPVGGVWAMKDGDSQPANFAYTTSGLQSAIDYLAGSKGKVFVGPGTLSISTTLTLASNLTLEGAGMGKTVLQHSGSTLYTMISGSSKTNWIIRDLTIDGNMASVSTYTAARWSREETIDLASCTDFSIDDVEIKATRGQGIYGTGCSRVSIRRCWIHDTDNWGSVFKASSDIDYIDNHVETVYTHGLYADAGGASADAARIRFIGNTAISCQNDASYTDSGIGMSVQVGTTYSVVDVQVIGNTAKSNGSMGFSLTPGDNASGFLGKMVVQGNLSEGHTSNAGIGFECIATNAVFTGNVAKNNKYHFTAQDAAGIAWSGNRTISALGSTQIAFFVGPSAVADPVLSLICTGNSVIGGTGFQVSSTAASHKEIIVTNNIFRSCDKGVLIQNNSIDRLVIRGNVMDCSDASSGIGRPITAYASEVYIEGNELAACAATNGDAIVISSGATTPLAVIRDNKVISGRYGMNFSGAVTTAYVSGNYIGTMGTANSNGKNNVTNWRDGGDNSWNYNTAAPASEYWHVGVRVYDTAVASAGNIGWVCTTAGTPGTWKTWGVVA